MQLPVELIVPIAVLAACTLFVCALGVACAWVRRKANNYCKSSSKSQLGGAAGTVSAVATNIGGSQASTSDISQPTRARGANATGWSSPEQGALSPDDDGLMSPTLDDVMLAAAHEPPNSLATSRAAQMFNNAAVAANQFHHHHNGNSPQGVNNASHSIMANNGQFLFVLFHSFIHIVHGNLCVKFKLIVGAFNF